MSINILGSLILFGFSSLFASEIGSYIKNSSELQVALLVGVVSVSSFGMLNNSFLQGGQRYLWLAGTGLSTVTLKIILAVGFVWMGYGVDGALLGALLSALTANIAVMFVVKSGAPSLSDSQDPASLCKVVFNMERLFPVLVANVCMSIMMQLDVLLVHNFFTTADASKYAAAATLGKAILYLPGGLVLALFPMVAEAQARKSRVGTYIFTASAMTLGMCLAGVLFYWLAGEFLIRQFFGEKYVGAEEILKYYSLAMIPMALLIVTEYFMMALGKVIFAWLTFFFAPIQVIIIYFYHDNLFRVIAIVGISGLILLFCGYLFLFRLIGAKLRFSE